ncbi:putative G-protein coupled receptors family 1 profile domain-containing protein [Seiridium cardinale]
MSSINLLLLSPEQQAAILAQPAMEVPEGEVPNFDNAPNGDAGTRAVLGLCMAITTLAVLGRFYTKIFIHKHFTIDSQDVAGFMANLSLAIYVTYKPGAFIHQWNVRLGEFLDFLKMLFVQSQIYIFTIVCIKVSILLEWKKIFVPRGTRNFVYWAAHVMIWTCLAFYLSTIIAFNVACDPYEANWNKLIGGTCNRVLPGFIEQSTGAIYNFVTDLVILLIPQRSIWKLHMSTKKKLGVSVIFSVGFLACVTALLRLIYTYRYAGTSDFTYVFSALTLCTASEMTCGFLVICIPTLPAVFTKMKHSVGVYTKPSKLESEGSNGQPSAWQRTDRSKMKHSAQNKSLDERELFPMTSVHVEGTSAGRSHEDIPPNGRGIWQTTQFEAAESFDPHATKDEYKRQEQWD